MNGTTNDKVILAIDDDEDILYTLKQICQYQQWTVLTAASYQEAQAHLAASQVDLVLVDYHMPGMDGIAVVRELRKSLSTIPIIILTVEERLSIVDKFMAAGASDYALKPIKAIDLISRIKVHLQYHERGRYYESYDKGISKVTLQTIENYLEQNTDFVTIDGIEAETGIKRKTLYRYLQYLEREGRVELEHVYQEAGRPKSGYRLIRSPAGSAV